MAMPDCRVLLGLAGDVEAESERLFPYTPPTNLLYALREALRMLQEEGLAPMFSDGTTVMPKQRALRCVRGAWKSFARSPASTPVH